MLKKGLLYIILLISFSIYSQSIELPALKTISEDFLVNFNEPYLNTQFSKLNLIPEKSIFSSYNNASKLNDIYFVAGSAYNYSKSSLLVTNIYRGQKTDSFNPYGVTKPSTSIIAGISDFILSELQK